MNPEFLLRHLAARPQAEPIDAIKFLYQNAFGVAHLLADASACADSVAAEMVSAGEDAALPPYEALGNGLCRLNLQNPQVRRLPPERIAHMMQATVAAFTPSFSRFQDHYKLLLSLLERYGTAAPPEATFLRLPFNAAALEAVGKPYLAPGAPIPRHSRAYREAYRPAYRIVLRRYGDALPLLCAIESALAEHGRATVVLDGYCASGKTTLAALLAPLYEAAVYHLDDFFLPAALRTRERLSQPGGNVHYERFASEVLAGLCGGAPFTYGQYNCHTGETTPVAAAPGRVTIIEGSYALHPAFADYYQSLHAIRAMLTISSAGQRQRLLRRNGATMLKRFQNEWIPLEIQYFKAYHKTWEGLIVLPDTWHSEDETEDVHP
ncbi:MAG: hypothetical protein PHO41_02720 [Eubacteriales bacterium]|nr:hypothetical protein [Eubacteriales bacterium]